MTLQEIKSSNKMMLTPADVCEVLGVKHHSLNLQAKVDISKLGFSATLIGTRLLIPRVAFLRWLGEDDEGEKP